MVHPVRAIVGGIIGAALALGVGTGSAEAQATDAECVVSIGTITPVQLAPGETGRHRALVTFQTDAPVDALPPYEWRLGSSRLASAASDRGTVRFQLWDRPGDGFGAWIEMEFTAGQRPGSERIPLLVHSTDEGAVSPSCQRAMGEVPLAVGADYLLTARTTVPPPDGGMTTYGEWFGSFRIVDGSRIEGDGTITTTLVGSCVRGTGANPMQISGDVVDDVMHVTIVGLESDEEPVTEADETDLRCIVRTLSELPGFFAAWGERATAVAGDPCPLQVPVGGGSVKCAGVTYQVTRLGGR